MKIFTYGIIAFLVPLALAYLQRGTGEKVTKSKNGQIILRMNKFYGIIGLFGVCLGLAIATMIVVTNGFVGVALMPLLIFVGTGLPCVLYYQNHILKFDEHTIEVKSVFGKVKSVKWADTHSVSFGAVSGLLSITDSKGTRVKIHQHIVGLSEFIKMMEAKTKWRAKDLKIPIEM